MTPNKKVANPKMAPNPAPKADSQPAGAQRKGRKLAPNAEARSAEDHAKQVLSALRKAHPDAHCELNHKNPFELIIATVLSAQSTDVAVNQVTPALFERWPTPEALAKASTAEVERFLNRLGMFRQKARNIVGLAQKLVADFDSEVPQRLNDLVSLPGVGRKTANVVLGVAFGKPEGVVVDTHVQRLAQRLGLTQNTEPPEIERDLMRLYPRRHWDILSHTLIFHGRRICTARKPACAACPVNDICPSAFKAELVGRKPARARNGSGKTSPTPSTTQTARAPRNGRGKTPKTKKPKASPGPAPKKP